MSKLLAFVFIAVLAVSLQVLVMIHVAWLVGRLGGTIE